MLAAVRHESLTGELYAAPESVREHVCRSPTQALTKPAEIVCFPFSAKFQLIRVIPVREPTQRHPFR